MGGKNPQQEEKEIGLLIQSIPHLGGKQILKILTCKRGLITLIGKPKNKELLIPFHSAEWVYQAGWGDMGKLLEGSVQERFVFDSYPKLVAAGKIGSDLLKTQMPDKPADELLILATACFRAIRHAKHPAQIARAFRLKLLRVEGELDPDLLEPELKALCLSRSFAEIEAMPLHPTLEQKIESLHF